MENTNARVFSLSSLVSDFNAKNKHRNNSEDGNSFESAVLQERIKDIRSVKKKCKIAKPTSENGKGASKTIKISDISSMNLLQNIESKNKKKLGLIISELDKSQNLTGIRDSETIITPKHMEVPNNSEDELLPRNSTVVRGEKTQEHEKSIEMSINNKSKKTKKIKIADIISSNLGNQNKKSIKEIKDIKGLNNFQMIQQFVTLQKKLFPVHLIMNEENLGSSLLEQTFESFCQLKQDQERFEYNDKQATISYTICKVEKLNEFIYRILTTEKNENEKKYLLKLKQPQEMAKMDSKKVKIDERFSLKSGNKEFFYCWHLEEEGTA